MNSTYTGPDGLVRCSWAGTAPEFPDYHDQEWGFPVDSDRQLFEKLCLESFQSGLSWRTILVKRENFRAAFKQFDFDQIAKFYESDIQGLLNDAGIVRHRGKIEAVINNAQRAHELIQEAGSLGAFFWGYAPGPADKTLAPAASTSDESVALAKALKKRGWKFLGPTTLYAFQQAMGMVNDHALECFVRPKVALARNHFKPPEMT